MNGLSLYVGLGHNAYLEKPSCKQWSEIKWRVSRVDEDRDLGEPKASPLE